MKNFNHLLRKCKSLRQFGRSSSYTSLRSKSTKTAHWSLDEDKHEVHHRERVEDGEVIYVGRSRRRYVVDSKYLTHPLLNALIEKSKGCVREENVVSIKCEVVLFDHLLWMLKNGDPTSLEPESFEELADLYGV